MNNPVFGSTSSKLFENLDFRYPITKRTNRLSAVRCFFRYYSLFHSITLPISETLTNAQCFFIMFIVMLKREKLNVKGAVAI